MIVSSDKSVSSLTIGVLAPAAAAGNTTPPLTKTKESDDTDPHDDSYESLADSIEGSIEKVHTISSNTSSILSEGLLVSVICAFLQLSFNAAAATCKSHKSHEILYYNACINIQCHPTSVFVQLMLLFG